MAQKAPKANLQTKPSHEFKQADEGIRTYILKEENSREVE